MSQRKKHGGPGQRKRPILSSIGDVVAEVVQRMQPGVFYIAPPVNAAPSVMSLPPAEPTPTISPVDQALLKSIAETATCLWDIERKLRPEEGEDQPKKLRLAYRRASRAIEAMNEGGVEIRDQTGQRYVRGSALIVHLQPTMGTTIEKIVDTVSPSIYFRDQLLKAGEVFVAVPPPQDVVATQDAGASQDAAAQTGAAAQTTGTTQTAATDASTATAAGQTVVSGGSADNAAAAQTPPAPPADSTQPPPPPTVVAGSAADSTGSTGNDSTGASQNAGGNGQT